MNVSDGAPTRILVVCTANVCRSPVAEHLLDRHLTLAGHSVAVSSAGVMGGRLGVHPFTVEAARMGGIDLTQHVSRELTVELLQTDGADLVIAMTREHLAQAVGLDRSIWPRAFTLKRLVRATRGSSMANFDGDWTTWLQQLGADRRPEDLLVPDPADDVADPYGFPVGAHMAMTAELNLLCEQLAASIPT